MKTPLFALALFAAAPAGAEPNRSQHPNAGQMFEVRFAPASTRLSSATAPDLSRVAGWAVENPTGLVVLDGYPDTAANPTLAVGRASSVRDALITAGVDPAQIVVAVYPKGSRQKVSVWVTQAGFGAVEARTASRGGRALPHVLGPAGG